MKRIAYALLTVAVVVGVPCHANLVRSLNIEDLTAKAGRIVSGRCVDVQVREDPVLQTTVTLVTLEVSRTLKGDVGSTLTVKMLGSARGDLPGIAPGGVPRFRPGEELILFLYPPARSGVTSPVGFGQGKFVKVTDKLGRERFVNEYGNRALFQRLSADAERRLAPLTPATVETEGLAPDLLLDVVNRLASSGAGR